MRTVPAAITAARQSSSSRLCKIWRIERTDGTVLRFTEHDRDLVVDGETFLSTASFDPSAIKASADLAVGDLEVLGAFDSSYITERDLLAGRYDGASFWVGECLWDNVAEGKDIQKFGWLGRVKASAGTFRAELLDPAMKLQQPIMRTFAAACDATLGDSRCGVDLGPLTRTADVTSVVSNRVFDTSIISIPTTEEASDYFWLGRVTFVGGENDGLSMDIKSFDGTTVELMLPMPFTISVGDVVEFVPGCSKTLAVCRYRFSNVVNYRGFPHVPVSDDVIKGIVSTELTAPSGGTVTPVSTGSDYVAPPADPDPTIPTMSGSPSMSA